MEALDSTTRLNHEEKIEWRGGYNWRGHTGSLCSSKDHGHHLQIERRLLPKK